MWKLFITNSLPITVFVVVFIIPRNVVLGAYTLIDAPPEEEEIPLNLSSTTYYIYRKRVPWEEAQILCGKKSSRLAVFPTEIDAKTTVAAIFNLSVPLDPHEYRVATNHWEFGLTRYYWFGLSDPDAKGKWVWNDEAKTPLSYSEMWGLDQPDNFGKDLCAGLRMSQRNLFHRNPHDWEAVLCVRKSYFICEWGQKGAEETMGEGIRGRSMGQSASSSTVKKSSSSTHTSSSTIRKSFSTHTSSSTFKNSTKSHVIITTSTSQFTIADKEKALSKKHNEDHETEVDPDKSVPKTEKEIRKEQLQARIDLLNELDEDKKKNKPDNAYDAGDEKRHVDDDVEYDALKDFPV